MMPRGSTWSASCGLALAVACANQGPAPAPVAPGPTLGPELLFQDVTAYARLESTGPLGVGAVTLADVDGDGHDDVVVPGSRRSIVYRNDGAGVFAPYSEFLHPERNLQTVFAAELTGDGKLDLIAATVRSFLLFDGDGTGHFVLSKSFPRADEIGLPSVVTFADFELTGKLSLVLGRLLPFRESELTLNEDQFGTKCEAEEGSDPNVVASSPGNMPPVRFDYAHRVGEQFMFANEAAGIVDPAKAQALMAFDINGDGPVDFIVGTEGGSRDLVYLNDGRGHFVERGIELGFDANTGAMGMDAGDIDGDGDAEIFVSDFLPSNGGPLWVRHDDGRYYNEAMARGLGEAQQFSAWGAGFHDFDLDGDVDLFLANSAPPGEAGGGCEQVAQERLYFENDGTGHFTRRQGAVGSGLDDVTAARGAAFGDIDEDGDVDVLVASGGAQLQVLRNDFASGHWLQIRLHYPWFEPAVGAKVTVTAGGRKMARWLPGTPSWGGSSSHRLFYGLAESARYEHITVVWPNGIVLELDGGPGDRLVDVHYKP